MEGGRGYTPQAVGELSLDQILMLMTDRKFLLNRKKAVTSDTLYTISKDGIVRGVAADGTSITGTASGKSRARELMEQQAAEAAKPKGRRGRRKRGV